MQIVRKILTFRRNFSTKLHGLLSQMRVIFALTALETSNIILNPLNPELNPICYLLALLGAHHFLHVSRIMVKSLPLRLLLS